LVNLPVAFELAAEMATLLAMQLVAELAIQHSRFLICLSNWMFAAETSASNIRVETRSQGTCPASLPALQPVVQPAPRIWATRSNSVNFSKPI